MSECQVGTFPLPPTAIHAYLYFDFISGIQNKFKTAFVLSGSCLNAGVLLLIAACCSEFSLLLLKKLNGSGCIAEFSSLHHCCCRI